MVVRLNGDRITVRFDDNFVDIRGDLYQIIPVLVTSIIFIPSLVVVFFLFDNIKSVLGNTLTLTAHRVGSSVAVDLSYLEKRNEFHIYQIVIDRCVRTHLAYEWYPHVAATRLTRGRQE